MNYEQIGAEIGRLVQEKQAAYGDSFGKSGEVLKTLYPQGIKPEQYGDALAVTRVVDKLFRIANQKDAFGESPWRDIAGYGILGAHKGHTQEKMLSICPTCGGEVMLLETGIHQCRQCRTFWSRAQGEPIVC